MARAFEEQVPSSQCSETAFLRNGLEISVAERGERSEPFEYQ